VTIVFYDTETTGVDAPFDQIIQFAAIRTDADLNELDRFEVRSRLQSHVIPAPEALMTNRITAADLIDPTLPSHYEMVRTIHGRLQSWSPALFMGYNSLRFDEHFMRQALYQTLHPPYLTNTNGNSRSDVLRMLQVASVYAPGAITIPPGDDGRPVFRLDRVAPANGFARREPHNAMADVEATIHLCRLLCERTPDIWSAFMRFSQKAAVAAFVSAEQVFCLSGHYGGRSHAWLVTAIGRNEQNTSEYYVFDLRIDPTELRALAPEELVERLKCMPRPVQRLRANAAPFMMPADEAPAFASGKDLGAHELQRRATLLQADGDFRFRLIAATEAGRLKPANIHVELQIYDGFLTSEDQAVLEAFHVAPWEQRLAIVDRLSDRRMRQLGRRVLFAERPGLFSGELRRKLERMRARRILGRDGELPWRTLAQALFEIEGILSEAHLDQMEFLAGHRNYLLECQVSANALLEAVIPAE
jgi:exodeoxyribonuclease I